MLIYKNIVDHINNRTYPLYDVPATYSIIPSYYLNGEDEDKIKRDLYSDPLCNGMKIVSIFGNDAKVPIYETIPGETMQTRLTIAHMVDMYFNKVPFSFVFEGDVFDVHVHLERYLNWVKQLVVKDNNKIEFVKRAIKFLDRMDIICQRMINKHNGNIKDLKKSFAELVVERKL